MAPRREKYQTVPRTVEALIDLWLGIARHAAPTVRKARRAAKALKRLNEAGREFVKALNETREAVADIAAEPVPDCWQASRITWRRAPVIDADVLIGKSQPKGKQFGAFRVVLEQVAEALGLTFTMEQPSARWRALNETNNALGFRLGASSIRGLLIFNDLSSAEGYVSKDGVLTLPKGRGHRLNPKVHHLRNIALAALEAEDDDAEKATAAKITSAIEAKASAHEIDVPDFTDNREALRGAVNRALKWARRQRSKPARAKRRRK